MNPKLAAYLPGHVSYIFHYQVTNIEYLEEGMILCLKLLYGILSEFILAQSNYFLILTGTIKLNHIEQPPNQRLQLTHTCMCVLVFS